MNTVTRPLTYTDNGVTLTSHLYLPESLQAATPAILVAPEWWGLGEFPKHSAERLAQAGYIALAMDVYGDNRLTDKAEQAGQWMNEVLADPQILPRRTRLALDALSQVDYVDPDKIAAIGFCFGGKVVLDMARRGQNLQGAVSFHGNLTPATPAQAGKIHAKLLIEHGGQDTMVSMEALEAFKKEMDAAGADYHIDLYPDAKHGFTNPAATENGRKNQVDLAYNEAAATQSWQAMLNFFAALFR